jgi:23S rRNA pseudouridine2605 synthase
MDDNDNHSKRGHRPKSTGARRHAPGSDQSRRTPGKPSFGAGKKPFSGRSSGKSFDERRGDKKAFAPKTGKAAPDEERPKRGFEEGERPFRKGPRPEGKPYNSEKPVSRRFDKDGEPRKTFPPRSGRGEGERRPDRPQRRFDGSSNVKASGFKPRPRPADISGEAGERIAKRLARAGIASRRDAEELIAAGRVRVNGTVLSSPALNVMPADVIQLDGTEIPPIERTRLFLFHKPAGVVTTNRDPQGRRTVFDVLPADLPRLMTVGRLDINTEGLLLLTNDGGLSRVLELPATGWLRRYRVRVHGKVEERALAGLREGIAVDGVFYGAVEATLDREQGTNAWLTLGLREGKNREVKNILGALGLNVTRLIRISYGPFQLDELPEGHVLEVKGRTLRDQLGERLIEESGANFEADIAQPFSNKPVRRYEPRPEVPAGAPKQARQPVGEGGLIKARRRREDSREEALGKLTTKRERNSSGKKPDSRERPESRPQGQRHANVWMAPGARPRGKDRLATEKPEGGPDRDRSPDNNAGSKPFRKARDDRPAHSGKGGPARSGSGPYKGPKGR